MNTNFDQPFDFKVSDSSENFDTWINREYIPAESRTLLRNANILFVPHENFHEQKVPVFPHKTEEVFHFLRRHAPKGINVDICIADDDYKEVVLHSALIIFGSIVVSAIALPVLKDLLSEYLKQKLFNKSNSNIKVSLTVVNTSGKGKQFDYEGPIENFDKVVAKIQRAGEK
ncbi:MAG: hypothetical protein KJ593_03375 [Candidatus Omnitrophica bacterium]|nr:hypothetical protein [Candidatus Omnitrophota bacterium]